jgi:hypothetical protein
MSKNSNLFAKAKIYDCSIVIAITIFLLLSMFLPEEEKRFLSLYFLGLYIAAHIGCFIYNLVPFLKKRLESVEMIYEGSFNQLVNYMHVAGLELKNQIGDRYVFATTYRVLENKKYLIQDQGNVCTVRSARQNIRILEKCLNLRELKGVENV